MRDFIFQGDEHSCGYASTRMFIIIKRKEPKCRYIPLEGRPPYTLHQLQTYAKSCGVELSFKKAESLPSLAENTVFPLLLVLKEGDEAHMVLLKKAKGDKFLIYDPAKGKEWIYKSQIIDKWTGVFGDGEQISDSPFNIEKKWLPHINYYVSSSICLVIGIGCLGGGFYFLNQDGNFLAPVIMFASYALSEVLRKRLAVHYMKEFDKKYLPQIEKVDDKYKERDFKQYQLYKKDVFSNSVIMIASTLLVIALGTLIGINSPSFFISVAGLISFHIVNAVFLGRSIRKQTRELELLESGSIKDKTTNLVDIQYIQDKAYSISNQLDFQKTLEIVVILFLSLIPFVVSGNYTLNYYLLHFFSLYALNSAVKEVVECHLNLPEREMHKDYFLNYINR